MSVWRGTSPVTVVMIWSDSVLLYSCFSHVLVVGTSWWTRSSSRSWTRIIKWKTLISSFSSLWKMTRILNFKVYTNWTIWMRKVCKINFVILHSNDMWYYFVIIFAFSREIECWQLKINMLLIVFPKWRTWSNTTI